MELPREYIDITKKTLGEALFARYLEGMGEEAPVSVRLNPRKQTVYRSVDKGMARVPWCPGGYYLRERAPFTFDPLMHAGCYYVQDASSMFVSHVVTTLQTTAARVLDVCGAPGGKSTALLSCLPEGSVVVTNDIVRPRAQVLAENIMKWGCPNTIVTCSAPSRYAKSGVVFDMVLCDVPCSGEGMFRKDANAIAEWSPQNVERCRLMQRDIVSHAWQCLREGGLLVYSTCTLNTRENEENVRWIADTFGAALLPVPIEDDWAIVGSLLPADKGGVDGPVYRFLPGVARGEGLFMAVMRKGGGVEGPSKPSVNRTTLKADRQIASICSSWLSSPEEFALTADASGRYVLAIPRDMVGLYEALAGSVNMVSAGIVVGGIRGRDIVPAEALALSWAASAAIPVVPLSYRAAIAYLQRNALTLPASIAPNYVMVSFRGAPLGFMKQMAGRTNNLYPKEWRIKSSYAPAAYIDPIGGEDTET